MTDFNNMGQLRSQRTENGAWHDGVVAAGDAEMVGQFYFGEEPPAAGEILSQPLDVATEVQGLQLILISLYLTASLSETAE